MPKATERHESLPSLAQVCEAPYRYFDTLDIAALNILCAVNLPFAEDIDPSRLLNWIDDAAEAVRFETQRHWYRFTSSPEFFNLSPGYYCCYYLLQTLQEVFGVKYNAARVIDPRFQDPKCLCPDFRDSRDLFIHGIIEGPGGTCASMPVLYVAVGRRLRYPLRLVEARGHLFFRWDDPDGRVFNFPERVNIEGAGCGIGAYPDEYYRTWPEPWTEREKATGCYLISKTPAEEFASFLITRGDCLKDNGRSAEALQAYQWACGLAPRDVRYQGLMQSAVRHCRVADEQALLQVADADRRRRAEREILQATFRPKPAEPALSAHNSSCKCFHCMQERNSSAGSQAKFLSHGPSCHCTACNRMNRAALGATIPPH
jgi:hypothetical protein